MKRSLYLVLAIVLVASFILTVVPLQTTAQDSKCKEQALTVEEEAVICISELTDISAKQLEVTAKSMFKDRVTGEEMQMITMLDGRGYDKHIVVIDSENELMGYKSYFQDMAVRYRDRQSDGESN